MAEVSDSELLDQFVRRESQEAFAALVRRYVALVYSVSLRHTASIETAQEITQAVFVVLARKAASLRGRRALAGWLYHAARLTAANQRRAEQRRRHREQEAYMQ
ncbi:MAG TPA: sigma factor, partial [Dongiaceae bacterium]|nr:sigma factor [Dongiaceae bacterium]